METTLVSSECRELCFFLKHAIELHIIILRRKRGFRNPYITTYTYTLLPTSNHLLAQRIDTYLPAIILFLSLLTCLPSNEQDVFNPQCWSNTVLLLVVWSAAPWMEAVQWRLAMGIRGICAAQRRDPRCDLVALARSWAGGPKAKGKERIRSRDSDRIGSLAVTTAEHQKMPKSRLDFISSVI